MPNPCNPIAVTSDTFFDSCLNFKHARSVVFVSSGFLVQKTRIIFLLKINDLRQLFYFGTNLAPYIYERVEFSSHLSTILRSSKMTDEQILISFIRKYAMDNYTKGWDVIVECFGDGDILEYLSETDFDLPKTIEAMQDYVNAYKEKEEEIRSTAF